MKIILTLTYILGSLVQAQRPKILCLHGGGQTAASFKPDIRQLEDALPEFEFVYANGAYGTNNSRLWIADPPGGKGEPTTDPAWADDSIDALDAIRDSQGPFHGILGYSQGSAFIPVYLSRVPDDTFEVALMFCGYLPETHLGLIGSIDQGSPFGDISALVYLGQNDFIISNPLTLAQAEEFTSPLIVTSAQGGHYVPGSSDPTFDDITSFLRDSLNPTPPTAPTPTPTTYETCAPSNISGNCVDSTAKKNLLSITLCLAICLARAIFAF
mmetsp:Transcript_8320/g.9579  ORF Transcript_8320/g.9579 Transcript_8320/m.9579 type:complete len:270 (-) Transcript_8320:536-1345(-)